MTSESNSNKKGKSIWTLSNVSKMVAVISSLGDRHKELNHEIWRLNSTTKLSTVTWEQPIEKLELDHTEEGHRSLYNIWDRKCHNIPYALLYCGLNR
jgi:hypothetical protein